MLLRYVNASLMQHSMVTLGVDQEVIAYDGSPLKYSHHMVAETFGPGQTTDVIVTIPTGTDGSKFAVYEGNLMLRNSNVAGYGGMMTFINVGTPPPPGSDVLGPKTSGMVVTPATTDGTVSVDLSASVSDVDTGNNNITAAEYFIDLIGANGGGTGMSGAFASPTEAVNTTLTPALLATLSDGNHALYVHGQDALGNWGSFNFVILKQDPVYDAQPDQRIRGCGPGGDG